jgi:thiol-disulfide isomerase/thioredoxin
MRRMWAITGMSSEARTAASSALRSRTRASCARFSQVRYPDNDGPATCPPVTLDGFANGGKNLTAKKRVPCRRQGPLDVWNELPSSASEPFDPCKDMESSAVAPRIMWFLGEGQAVRVVPCFVAVLLCLSPAGCRMFGKKPAAGPTTNAPGADATLRADRTATLPVLDRGGPPPGVNGMLAGQVIDYSNQRTPAAFIQVAESTAAGAPAAAPIEVPADNQGYFTIQGLQVGHRYTLTARARNGSRQLTGKTWATAPDPKVVIRLNEEVQAPPPPVPPPSRTAPATENRAPATGQRRAAELGPPTGLNTFPPRSAPPTIPEPPDRSVPRAEFRPDKTAADQGWARSEPPMVEVPPWAPRPPSTPPFPSEPPPRTPGDADFGPARVPSCILTGETLHNFALNDLSGQPWEFRSHRGRVVLLDFWGSWCPPCLQTIPHLRNLQDRYGPYGLEVLGIAYEEGPPLDQAQKVSRVRQRLGINYRILLANDSSLSPCPVKTQFGVNHFPTAILLDERGRIIWRSEGIGPHQLREMEIVIRQQLGMR